MSAADIVKTARKNAGLTQAQLAKRAGTTQSALSRLERGHVSPSFELLERLVRLCESSLDVRLVPQKEVDAESLEATLALTVTERLDQLVRTVSFIRAGRAAMASNVD